MSGGGFGFTIGSQVAKSQVDGDHVTASQARSSIGSLNGDTQLVVGKDVNVHGSDVLAGGDILIKGKSVVVDPGKDNHNTRRVQEFQQSGLTIGVSVPAIEAAQAAAKAVEQTGKSRNARVNAMSAFNAGWKGYTAAQKIADLGTAMSQIQAGDAKGAAETAGIKLSITYGAQRSRSTSESQQTATSGSEIHAQGKAAVIATGGGAVSDITVIGSDVAGKKGTVLLADDAIDLHAAAQTSRERSKNSSAGGKFGVQGGYENGSPSLGIVVGANVGKGFANGDETHYVNTHVGDANSATVIQSGGSTALKGAQILGAGVTLNASELAIQSLQDTATFEGKQKNARGEVTIGYGASGSGSASKTKISADYAAVNELSGIFAQDQGYHINVDGHTDLIGAVITSSDKAEIEGNNSIVTGTLDARDIENHSRVKASSVGIGGNGSFMPGRGTSLQSILGFGSESSNESSVTRSGINTSNITITQADEQRTRTGKSARETLAAVKTILTSEEALNYTGLGNTFDADKVQKEIDLQREVSLDFSENSQNASAELKLRKVANDEAYKRGQISAEERNRRNALLDNYTWLMETASAGLATPSNSLGGSLAAALSPTVAHEIGQHFKETGQEGSVAHYMAHGLLGASVAAATGNNVLGNALAAAGSEAAAPLASQLLYGKDAAQLLPKEKEVISAIANLTGAGLSGAVGGDGRSFVSGGLAGRTAVENNYLTHAQLKDFSQKLRNCHGDQCDKVFQEMLDTNIRQQDELRDLCAVSADYCLVKYGHVLEEMDANFALIKKLDIDETLDSKFRDYFARTHMANISAGFVVAQHGWAERLEKKGIDKETAQMIAATVTTMINGGGVKGGKGRAGARTSIPKVKADNNALIKIGENSRDTKTTTTTRPTPKQSEIDVGKNLGKGYRYQVSFKDGKEVPYGTKGSVRPDWCDGKSCSIEVKNYNLSKNANALVNNVAKQAMERQKHLPKGIRQVVTIDVRGQSFLPETQNRVVNDIVKKSKGVISEYSIEFKEK